MNSSRDRISGSCMTSCLPEPVMRRRKNDGLVNRTKTTRQINSWLKQSLYSHLYVTVDVSFAWTGRQW